VRYQREIQVASIAPDSSTVQGEIDFLLPAEITATFRVELTLTNADHAVLSGNHYVLLRGNQEQAGKDCALLARRLSEAKSHFPTADYYRFFPELGGEDYGAGIPAASIPE